MKHFEPFDRILIRTGNNSIWTADFYDHSDSAYPEHWTIGGGLIADTDILPYNDETKHLHNTVGEFTKWEPKKGEPILVKDVEMNSWNLRIFLGMRDNKYVCTSDPSIDFHTATASWDQAKPYINPFLNS